MKKKSRKKIKQRFSKLRKNKTSKLRKKNRGNKIKKKIKKFKKRRKIKPKKRIRIPKKIKRRKITKKERFDHSSLRMRSWYSHYRVSLRLLSIITECSSGRLSILTV